MIIIFGGYMETLLALSIALFVGLMLSRVAKLLKLPAVTAYLVAGILVGPFVLGQLGDFLYTKFEFGGIGFISLENVKSFSIICDVALGFIAFSIGNEFRLSQLKKIGKQATIIGILQAVVTTILVDAALIGLHFWKPEYISISAAITLGAIATATAPAATLMVVKQYKAKGPLTEILLPVVALDDAVGLIVFSVSFGVAKALVPGGTVSLISIIVEPLLEVILSLALGALMGVLFTYSEKFFHSRSKRLSMSITFVLLTVALSMIKFSVPIGNGESLHIGFSSLLTCMMLGTIFCNICDFSLELMDRVDRWTAPLFVLFFVISGAELDLSIFTGLSVVIVGLVYIAFRSIGKYVGAFFSAKISKCDNTIVKYLGITLLPQAGVALGMAIKVGSEKGFETDADIVRNITLFAVLLYELFGPMLTKMALMKAGEIIPEGKTSARIKPNLEWLLHHQNHHHQNHKNH